MMESKIHALASKNGADAIKDEMRRYEQVSVCVFVSVCVCSCVCMYTHAHTRARARTHTHTQQNPAQNLGGISNKYEIIWNKYKKATGNSAHTGNSTENLGRVSNKYDMISNKYWIITNKYCTKKQENRQRILEEYQPQKRLEEKSLFDTWYKERERTI